MKLTPREELIVERMAPGVLCAEGFLGSDGRSLGDILAADSHTVESLDLTHKQIAAKLGEIMQAAADAFGNPVSVGDGLSAVAAEAMGPIGCPWGGCGVFAKGEIELTDARSGKTLRLTPLSVHLIGRHGFYQGKGARYRLEPEELARLLDISGGDEA
ncbi:MAG: hypothetical protein QGG42_08945 [Phycisphaerae bacterium]|jgi:hypothetical protein|nr:hypothetical protein [Phycisphaerae bacterium]